MVCNRAWKTDCTEEWVGLVDTADVSCWSVTWAGEAVVITTCCKGTDVTLWLWVAACTEEEDVTGCTAFTTLTLDVAWSNTPSVRDISAGCDVTATGTAVEDARPARILYASLGTAHCTTTPVEPEGFGRA